MDLSWTAAIFIPTVLTPAMVIYILFRFTVPKSKSLPNSDLSIFSFFLIVVTFFNIDLIAFLADTLWTSYKGTEKSSAINLVLHKTFSQGSYQPKRLPQWVYEFLLSNKVKSTNIFGILNDLHLKPAIIYVSCTFIYHILKIYKSRIIRFHEHAWSAKTIDWLTENIYKVISLRCKRYFFSYWNYVFDFDEDKEILMLDILSDDENMYSAMFRDWTPDDDASADAIGSIGISNILKYGPAKEQKDDNGGTKYSRRWALIRNKGVLYVPYSKDKNYTFMAI